MGILPSVRLVTFDAVGTLIFPHPGVGEIYAEVAAAHGLQLDPDWLAPRFRDAYAQVPPALGTPDNPDYWREIVRLTFGEHTPAEPAFSALFAELWQTFARSRRWRLDPAARQLIAFLQGRGLQLALLSNADSRFRQVFAELELADVFDAVFLSAEVGARKPEPGIFRAVEAHFGLLGEQILHIGDHPEQDIAGAAALGWHTRLVGAAGLAELVAEWGG